MRLTLGGWILVACCTVGALLHFYVYLALVAR